MSYTLADIQAGIQARGYATDTAATQTILINTTGRAITLLRRWRWREAAANLTTVLGNPSVSLAPLTNMQDIDAIRLSVSAQDNSDLTYWESGKLRERLQIDQTNARPRHWTRYAGGVLVYPRPDAVYSLPADYLIGWTDLVAPTDVPVLPQEYRDLLVYGPLMDLAERERDIWQKYIWQDAYNSLLQTMQAADGREPRQTSLRVVESGFFHHEGRGDWPWVE
jgi:hypothetical protein